MTRDPAWSVLRGQPRLAGAAGRKMAQDPAQTRVLDWWLILSWYHHEGDQRMLRCLHNMSRVTIALITWPTMSAALFCSTRPLSGVEVSAEYPDQITEAPPQMATHFPALDGQAREESGQHWPCPRSQSGYLIFSTWDKLGRSLSSPPYPGQARPRSARSDKVRPILLMRSWWPGISLDPAPYSQVLTCARSELRAHHLRPACTYLTWTLKDRGVSDH